MRTGTRCTILVKLPVAFSGGSRLNTEPEAGDDALDRADDVAIRVGIDLDVDRLAGLQIARAASP